MTEALLEAGPEQADKKAASGRSFVLNSVWSLFAMTTLRLAVSRRLLILALLYLLPISLTLLIRYHGSGFPGPHVGYDPLFCELVVIFGLIPQALIPFTSLVYSSGMIQDEVEEQTITYLLIRPLPRWSIFAAKLLATMAVTIALTSVFTAITFLVIGWGQADYWSSGGLERMLKTIALFALSTAAYDAIFSFLGLLMKRSLLAGIAYIIVLEAVIANLDFVVRKVTVIHYFRILSERWMGLSDLWPSPSKMTFNIDMDQAPGVGSCLLTVFGGIVFLTAISGLIMESREFRVKTPEGN